MHAPRVATGDRRRRLVIEALEVVADEGAIDVIVADALAMAGRPEIPTIAEGLRGFLTGNLLDAIEVHAGVDAADRFEESIEIILRAAAVEHESAAAPTRGESGKLVLIASLDRGRVDELGRALAKHADVEPVDDAAALPALAWASLASAIVIDWARFPLDDAMIDELGAGASEGAKLVLWGAPPEIEARLLASQRATWLSCARGATPKHVAGMVLALLSEG